MRKIKTITIDADKCTGCRLCENICSAFHADPKYSTVNTRRARIQVVGVGLFPEEKGNYMPVFAGPCTMAECHSRSIYIIEGKEYSECAFCPNSCPSRELFKEPDSDLPLKCDTCLEEPLLAEPLCVKWCLRDALTYTEREEEGVEENKGDDKEVAVGHLVQRYGLKEVMDIINRLRLSRLKKEKVS